MCDGLQIEPRTPPHLTSTPPERVVVGVRGRDSLSADVESHKDTWLSSPSGDRGTGPVETL